MKIITYMGRTAIVFPDGEVRIVVWKSAWAWLSLIAYLAFVAVLLGMWFSII